MSAKGVAKGHPHCWGWVEVGESPEQPRIAAERSGAQPEVARSREKCDDGVDFDDPVSRWLLYRFQI